MSNAGIIIDKHPTIRGVLRSYGLGTWHLADVRCNISADAITPHEFVAVGDKISIHEAIKLIQSGQPEDSPRPRLKFPYLSPVDYHFLGDFQFYPIWPIEGTEA